MPAGPSRLKDLHVVFIYCDGSFTFLAFTSEKKEEAKK